VAARSTQAQSIALSGSCGPRLAARGGLRHRKSSSASGLKTWCTFTVQGLMPTPISLTFRVRAFDDVLFSGTDMLTVTLTASAGFYLSRD